MLETVSALRSEPRSVTRLVPQSELLPGTLWARQLAHMLETPSVFQSERLSEIGSVPQSEQMSETPSARKSEPLSVQMLKTSSVLP